MTYRHCECDNRTFIVVEPEPSSAKNAPRHAKEALRRPKTALYTHRTGSMNVEHP
jgi:hypothetical protein